MLVTVSTTAIRYKRTSADSKTDVNPPRQSSAFYTNVSRFGSSEDRWTLDFHFALDGAALQIKLERAITNGDSAILNSVKNMEIIIFPRIILRLNINIALFSFIQSRNFISRTCVRHHVHT